MAAPSEGPIDSTLTPDPVRGQALYAVQCAACHGDNGEGRRDASGDIAFPPLWGDHSFNIGAGMARLYKAAGFVKHNMPPAVTREPPLGQQVMPDQDAVDIASYFINQPRPDFANKAKDWPRDPNPRTRGTDRQAAGGVGRHTTRFLHLYVMSMSLVLSTLGGFSPPKVRYRCERLRASPCSLLALLIAPTWTPSQKHRRAIRAKRAAAMRVPSTRYR